MNMPLGRYLGIRSMAYIAAEHIPYFWPMRAFIHHNPLHGLEHLPFEQAVERGAKIFHAHGFLPRSTCQHYSSEGQVDHDALRDHVRRFVEEQQLDLPFDLLHWLLTDITENRQSVIKPVRQASVNDIYRALQGEEPAAAGKFDPQTLKTRISEELLNDYLLYEVIDELYATDIGDELDEAVIRACLDFFDEGQSVWHMPDRDQGFLRAWLKVAGRDVHRTLEGLIGKTPDEADRKPENIIACVMDELRIAEENWVATMSRELTRLHGWVGFIRWRSNNSQYYWQQNHPGDLVDFLAVRLLLELTLIKKHVRKGLPQTIDDLKQAIDSNPMEIFLRHQFGQGEIMAEMAQQIDEVLHMSDSTRLEKVYLEYTNKKRELEAKRQAERLLTMAEKLQVKEKLLSLDSNAFGKLYETLLAFEHSEGMFWLQAMESRATSHLMKNISLQPLPAREKRPFAKALFCIDTRSERIRRHLESVGDYQTYGIAGFFGVPVSFMELGKGSEHHLCPVLLTPKNLVLEMTPMGKQDVAALSTLEHGMHELKESVLAPFVTVEAIGLLFGFDMIGKTLIPASYNQWRKKLREEKPPTHLMLDKLSREQADSVVRAVQRAVIMKAVSVEYQVEVERVSDTMVKELREAALGHQTECPEFAGELELEHDDVQEFIHHLRSAYRINKKFAHLQMERLGRIGFTLEEQTRFVTVALKSIGLNRDFSRFILMIGHGSSSENNPYESALDCGACGGSHGLVSARVISQMANKPDVRKRLREQGIDIPDDTWFVPALHNTTTDEITLHDLSLLPPSHLVYLDRLREGLVSASRLCAQERLPTLQENCEHIDPAFAMQGVRRNSLDWSQVRPEWGLSGNAYFVIGRRAMTQGSTLSGRAFLHSYDYRLDPKRRLLENILTGPLVVGQWINMEHYFSTVDNERFGSGSKVYHNVAGRFGVMTGNFSDLRTGLPSQTVLKNGQPYHQPMRLITVIEAPFDMAVQAIDDVVAVKRLVRNEWIRLIIIDPETSMVHLYECGQWKQQTHQESNAESSDREVTNA